MKMKLIRFLFFLVLVLSLGCVNCIAESIDLSTLSDEQLNALLEMIKEQLEARETASAEMDISLFVINNGSSEKILYGFANKDGETVIEKKYAYAYDFQEGLALVKLTDGTWAYIDKEDSIQISIEKNNTPYSFSEGIARIHDDNNKTWKFIDKQGNVLFDNSFASCEDFSEGFALVKIQVDGEVSYGYIDKQGQLAISLKKDNLIALGKFSEGLAKVSDHDRYKGYINKKGQLVIPCRFLDCGDFHDGCAYAQASYEAYFPKYGYINTEGKKIIEEKYEGIASDFHDGVVFVAEKYKGNNIAVIYKSDGTFKRSQYTTYTANRGFPYSEGLCAMYFSWTESSSTPVISRMGFMNEEGELILPAKWYTLNSEQRNAIKGTNNENCYVFQNGICKVIGEDGYSVYYINHSGQIIIDGGIDENLYSYYLKEMEKKKESGNYSQLKCELIATDYLESILKNPNSLQIHSISVAKSGNSYIFTIDYSAQNSLGGYNRSTFICQVDFMTGKVVAAF